MPTHLDQPDLLQVTAPRVNGAADVPELCALLRGRGWRTARQLCEMRPEWTERHIREIASVAEGRIISGPGMPGYCLESEISDDELSHAGESLISQGRKMESRGIRFKRLLALRKAHAKAA